MKKFLLLSAVCFLPLSSLQATNFVTKVSQGAGNNWTALIWSNPPNTTLTSPAAGNTYECLDNGVAFGVTAGGTASTASTRIRNPATAGVQTFPGDSLTLDANSEIRAKQAGAILNFPGVGGNPGLILNGGVFNAGDDTVFVITGKVSVTATSFIVPADQGAGTFKPLRGFNFWAQLSGNGPLVIAQADVQVAQEVSSASNSFSGGWIVKAGWLKGTGVGSLGGGDITIDPGFALSFSGATLSNGPAQLELMYDIKSPSKLTLRNGGKMILHQDCRFVAASIEGTDLTPGTHPYAELAASFPNNFAPGGSGSISVPRIVTVTTVDNENPAPDATSLLDALGNLQVGDLIRFNISGPGPHVIATPIGGYPLISNNNVTIDGYSQPGSSPNTNPILGGNNAQIQIVLDSTSADSAPNPNNSARPFRRSTRLDFPDLTGNTGYGETENCILGVFGANHATIRGLSFIARRTPGSEDDPSIYCVALVNHATDARVQGCWFGVAPGAGTSMADVKPGSSAVAAFRWRIGGDVFSEGLVVGTDGDGVADRAEFNVMVGGRISLALELPRARVSGNYVNVFPDGLHFVDIDANYQLWRDVYSAGGSDPDDVSIENFENGRVTDDTVIGTNGDGVSDADERNVFASVVYDHLIEFYSSAPRAVIAGNYFAVGVDGVTPAPLSMNVEPDFAELGGGASVRIGSNGDGLSDNLEGNLIVNGTGSTFVIASATAPIVARGNKMMNNNYQAVPFADGQNSRNYLSYYGPFVTDSGMVVPVIKAVTNHVLAGTMVAPNGVDYIAAFIDVYTVDPAALAKTNYWPAPITHPSRWLGRFTDNGPGDLDPAANQFAFNLSSFGVSDDTYLTVAVTYSQDANVSNAGRAVTSPMALPIAARPSLKIQLSPSGTVLLSWLANQGAYTVQQNDLFSANNWADTFVGPPTYTSGRNILEVPFDQFSQSQFFRLRSQ